SAHFVSVYRFGSAPGWRGFRRAVWRSARPEPRLPRRPLLAIEEPCYAPFHPPTTRASRLGSAQQLHQVGNILRAERILKPDGHRRLPRRPQLRALAPRDALLDALGSTHLNGRRRFFRDQPAENLTVLRDEKEVHAIGRNLAVRVKDVREQSSLRATRHAG